MITIDEVNKFNNVLSMSGLSSDELPIGTFTFYGVKYQIKNASSYYAIDTTQLYLYDEENSTWIEQ